MRKILLLLCLLACVCVQLRAQYNQGARFTSMGKASAALTDLWSMNANPAGITQLKRTTAGVNFTRYFFGDELSEQNLALVTSFGNNSAGVSVSRYGISEFNEIKGGFALAKQFGNQLSIGLKANLHQLKISNYGTTSTFSIDAGAIYALSEKVALGLYVNNPTVQAYKTSNIAAKIPTALHFGASYRPSNKVIVATTVTKTLDEKINVALGIDYSLLNAFSVRGGLSANTFKQFFGFGLNYEKFLLDIAVESHPKIGYTPQISLSYAF